MSVPPNANMHYPPRFHICSRQMIQPNTAANQRELGRSSIRGMPPKTPK